MCAQDTIYNIRQLIPHSKSIIQQSTTPVVVINNLPRQACLDSCRSLINMAAVSTGYRLLGRIWSSCRAHTIPKRSLWTTGRVDATVAQRERKGKWHRRGLLRRWQHTTNDKTTDAGLKFNGIEYPADETFNIPGSLEKKLTRRLYEQRGHPLAILTNLIKGEFPSFSHFTNLSPIVSAKENFDDLLIPRDHPSRASSDTFYINKSTVLRTHTSAHQLPLLRQKDIDRFLVFADVYRRDEIDRSHYPVFHQVEGLCTFDASTAVATIKAKHEQQENQGHFGNIYTELPPSASESNPVQAEHSSELAAALGADLRKAINGMIKSIFRDEKELKVRWVESYFPFTSPSWEVEVFYQGKWLELLGCGITRQQVLEKAGAYTS